MNGAASTPYNLAVGGTQFSDIGAEATYWSASNAANFSSAFGYIPETTWNESCDFLQPLGPMNCVFFPNGNFSTLAGGGGASRIYSKPIWQTGTGVPADGFRDIPDVSLAAASGHDDLVYCNSLGETARAKSIRRMKWWGFRWSVALPRRHLRWLEYWLLWSKRMARFRER